MKITWIHLLLGSLLVALAPACHADPVELSVSGNLYGEYEIFPNSSISDTFTLDQDTQFVSIGVDIYRREYNLYPLTGTYEVTLTAPDGATYAVAGDSLVPTTAFPTVLSQGNYILTLMGGQCGTPCLGGIAATDYFAPAAFTEIGGSINGGSKFSSAFFFELTGETVPEPASWLLITTSILCLSALYYRRRLPNSVQT